MAKIVFPKGKKESKIRGYRVNHDEKSICQNVNNKISETRDNPNNCDEKSVTWPKKSTLVRY